MLRAVNSVEDLVILNALRNRSKKSINIRSTEEILDYFSVFRSTGLGIFKSSKIIPSKLLEGIITNTKNIIFHFKSPFNPIKPFKIDYENGVELHDAWVHYYPLTNFKGKNAIIYLHGWGRASFFAEEHWHFPLIKKLLNADIFTLELPYHMHRNPIILKSSFSGQGLLDGDPIRTIEGLRQAVNETETLFNSLKQSYQNVGIIGLSLGAHIATIFNLLNNQDILILAALVGAPFHTNLKNLKISPNFLKSLSRPEVRDLLEILDFIKIPVQYKNINFRLFGGMYDQLISPLSVKRLGMHLDCPTYLFPTGHFTWPVLLPRALKLMTWSN